MGYDSIGPSRHVASFAGATVLPGVVYGINSVLTFMALRLFWENRRSETTQRRTQVMTAYIIILHLICTFHWVTCSIEEGVTLIRLVESVFYPEHNRNLSSFFFFFYSIPITYAVLTFLTDGLLLWRCWVLYSGCRGIVRCATWMLLLLPSLSLIAFGVMLGFGGFRSIISTGHPASVLATNITFTGLTVGRLGYHQRRLNKLLNRSHSSEYTNIVAMVVESALLNVVFQLLTVIFVVVPNDASFIFDSDLLGQTQVFSTLLIIFRVARGKAWTHRTSAELSTQIRFEMVPRQTAGASGNVVGNESESIVVESRICAEGLEESLPGNSTLASLDRKDT